MSDKRIKQIRLYLCILSLIAYPLSSLASTRDELKQTQKALEQSREKQEKLLQENEKLETELQGLQEHLVELADAIQKGEEAVSDSEEKLRILGEQLKVKEIELKKHRKNLELLIQAALTLSRTPPEAMLMMPTSAMESMKTARALKMTSDDIRRQALSISQQMAELDALKITVGKHHQALVTRQAALDKQRKGLNEQLVKRTELQKKLRLESKKESEHLAKLAKKAEDLKDLLASIEKEEGERREASGKDTSSQQMQGHMRLSVAGRVVRTFGTPLGRNGTSKGVVISARAGARVTSPYDGEVVFTGPFLDYGQMVIIRHSGELHTLLAGLAKIDVSTGQFLLEGEPIGAMGEGASGSRLYIELRKNNQPIDPALWMNGLNKKN